MLSDISEKPNLSTIAYPDLGSSLPFSNYIDECRRMIEARRDDLHKAGINARQVIDANSPYELRPSASTGHIKYGALLIHGLFDCPFSLRDIANQLHANGMLVRSLLLPGHGTQPADLLHVTYHDWIKTVRYGVESLRKEVDHVILVGYSMGAALSLHHALQDPSISKLVLLAPAVKIKAPVDIVVSWHKLLKLFRSQKDWIYIEDENDYAKYQSIAFNPVTQVTKLVNRLTTLQSERTLHCPMYMVMSREDETVSSHYALDFFSSQHHPDSRFLLYTSQEHRYQDTRICPRLTSYPKLDIKHFSHIASLFRPDNAHYGNEGDYAHASHANRKEIIYGAYNHLEVSIFDALYNLGLVRKRHHELTYNPDFTFMADEITRFII